MLDRLVQHGHSRHRGRRPVEQHEGSVCLPRCVRAVDDEDVEEVPIVMRNLERRCMLESNVDQTITERLKACYRGREGGDRLQLPCYQHLVVNREASGGISGVCAVLDHLDACRSVVQA
eukprot:3002671-Prymnesium_polylepis.1